jgi:autotransporter adhesin
LRHRRLLRAIHNFALPPRKEWMAAIPPVLTTRSRIEALFSVASTASAAGSSVFGRVNTVNATNAVVMGSGNTVTGTGGIAIGSNVNVAGTNAVAVGNGASANFGNSTAIGNGATATRANQQVFGTASNTYTMSGINSPTSTAAQTGSTQIVTSDAGGNLATNSLAGLGIASIADISAINSQLGGINARLDNLSVRSDKAFTGVAMAFAMAGVPTLMPNERFAVSMNWGTFQGSNGLALNAAYRLEDRVQLNAGFAYGANQNQFGGRAGVRVGW